MKDGKHFIPEVVIYSIFIFLTFIPFFIPRTSVAFSSDAGISAIREFNKTLAAPGEEITVTFRLNNVSDIIRGFYYSDHIPSNFSVITVSVYLYELVGTEYLFREIAGYTEEFGDVGDVYEGSVPHRWVIEIPPNFVEDHQIGINADDESWEVKIVYTITSQIEGDFLFPNYNWVGKLQSTNSSIFGYDYGSEVIHIYIPPAANFSGYPTSGLRPLMVSFTDESTGTISSWNWIFGDGFTSTERDPNHEYTSAGNYTVSLTVKGPGGEDTKTDFQIVITEPPPIADFIGSLQTGTAPLFVQFTDKSTGTISSWNWIFGDGFTSTEPDPNHEYNSAGNYTVSLTVKGPGGEDTKTDFDIVVTEPPPIADFIGSPQTGTAPLFVQFTDKSTENITTYWDFGDGFTSSEQDPNHEYTAEGAYTVKLTVSGTDGTINTKGKTNYIQNS